MKIRKVGVARAKINGLTEESFSLSDNWLFFKTDILFEQTSCHLLKNLANIKCGNFFEKTEAKKYHSKMIQQFHSAKIYNGDDVIVLFEKANSNIIAIAKPCSNKWIDLNDYFKVKNFNDFNIIISDLTVY